MRFDPCFPLVQSPVLCRETLLCDTIVVPTVPYLHGTSDFLRLKWQKACEALANHQGSEARHIFLSATDQTAGSDSMACSFLFDAANRLLADNYYTAADHCIQKGLNLLSGTVDRSRDKFNGPLWLVMASSALIRGDFEGCDVWLNRARQSFHRASANNTVLSQKLQHWNGDWFAIEGCRQAGSGDLDKAESLLNSARQCHLRSGAFTSAAKDLNLRSRRRMLGEQWDAAESDLVEAQTLIRLRKTADDRLPDMHDNDLCCAIENDLKKIRTKTRSLSAAKWN